MAQVRRWRGKLSTCHPSRHREERRDWKSIITSRRMQRLASKSMKALSAE
jgi:hypothetical protein